MLSSTGLSSSTHTPSSSHTASTGAAHPSQPPLTNTVTNKATNPDLFKSMAAGDSDRDSRGSSVGETETIKHSSSSIIGLRTAAFDHKSKSEESSKDEDGPKPRPPPKPRPWSIVGVDRKSGEYTQVESSATSAATQPVNENSPPATSRSSGLKGVKKSRDEKNDKTSQQQSQPTLGSATSHRGSVRDMISNLNKPDSPGGTSVAGQTANSVRDRIANMNKSGSGGKNSEDQDQGAISGKKRLNSLSSGSKAGDQLAKSPSTRPKHSPINNRKKDLTSDDPRILKLDDDFLYDDPVNV